MSERSKPGALCAAALVAIVALGAAIPSVLPPDAVAAPTSREPQALTWAQASDGGDIQQVGEGESTDTEGLDDGPTASQEPVADDDVETLDQGAPPTTTVVDTAVPVDTTAVQTVAAPIDYGVSTSPSNPTTSTPAQTSGPSLPPGFGSRQVRVSAGRNGFPLGLEPCHVGAVTGRAYVGIKCGEDGESVVGHAANFQDFPWVVDPGFPFQPGEAVVTDPNFPFDEGSPFWLSSEERAGENTIIVSAGGRDAADASDTASSEPVSSSSVDSGAVTLAQRAEDRAARRQAKNDSTASEQAASDSTSDNAKSRQRSRSRGKSETVQYQTTAESKKSKAGNGGKHKAKKDNATKGGKGKQKHKNQNKGKNKK